jgi:hypothetical protein
MVSMFYNFKICISITSWIKFNKNYSVFGIQASAAGVLVGLANHRPLLVRAGTRRFQVPTICLSTWTSITKNTDLFWKTLDKVIVAIFPGRDIIANLPGFHVY